LTSQFPFRYKGSSEALRHAKNLKEMVVKLTQSSKHAWAALAILSAGVLGACAQRGASNPSAAPAAAPASSGMGFFITSTNPGKGADLGGLAGADAHCQSLAAAAGAGSKTWRAYLSATAAGGAAAVNARDRVGRGPWANAKGVTVATSVADLHSANNKLSKENSLTEKGAVVSGRGDPVNLHDVLTGSNEDGTVATSAPDTTCGNWTKSGEGSAIVGHHDRIGLNDSPPMKSWNASHGSRGCGMDALRATGGGGLYYCFAVN
jgi:hypothetical protein